MPPPPVLGLLRHLRYKPIANPKKEGLAPGIDGPRERRLHPGRRGTAIKRSELRCLLENRNSSSLPCTT